MEPLEDAGPLERAADYYNARRKAQQASRANVFGGIFLLLWGSWWVSISLINLPLVLLGAFLLVQGAWFWMRPSSVSLFMDGLGLLFVGAWNIFAFLFNALIGGMTELWLLVLGVFLVGAGIYRFLTFPRAHTIFQEEHDEEVIARLHSLAKQVGRASLKKSTDIIQFQVKGFAQGHWRMLLGRDAALFLNMVRKEVVVACQEDVTITQTGKILLSSNLKASLQIRDKTYSILITPRALTKYQAWKLEQSSEPAPEPASGQEGIVAAEQARMPAHEEEHIQKDDLR